MRSDFLWKSATLLTIANLIAAISNYAFQGIMGRHLPLVEFGYLNSALGLVMLLTVPLTAVSQAVTHYLAQHHASANSEKLAALHASSQLWLIRLTWIFSLAAVVVIRPLTEFFHFPRVSVMLLALVTIPLNMWAVLGQASCAGLSRFRLLAALMIGSAVVRLVSGAMGVQGTVAAEAGLMATCLGACVLMTGVFLRPSHIPKVGAKLVWNPDFVRYTTACLAVCLGNFLFLQSDQIIAQRYLSGSWLGLYSAAGLLGRAVVWGSLPVLTVFFTQRSAQTSSSSGTKLLLLSYLGLIAIGTVVLVMGENLLTRLILGGVKAQDPSLLIHMTYLINRFAVAMVPIALLQVAGFFYLATRRMVECYTFGVLGLTYSVVLTLYGQQTDMLLSLMFGGATLSVLVLCALSLARWSRTQP